MFIPISDENHYYHRPVVNFVLIGMNVFAFVLLNWVLGGGAAFEALVLVPAESSGIKIFTSMFLHAGLLHLLGNMLYLYIAGDNVEAAFGYIGYPVFYLLCGIGAAVTHLLFHSESIRPVVGASGAISGVLGAYVVLYPQNKIRFWYFLWYFIWGTVEIRAIWAIGVYFAMQLFYWWASQGRSMVAYEAHIGGFVVGVGLAYAALKLEWVRRERPHAWLRMPESARARRLRQERGFLEPLGESFLGLGGGGGGTDAGVGPERRDQEAPPREPRREPPVRPSKPANLPEGRPIEVDVLNKDTLHFRDVIPLPRVPRRVLARAQVRKPRAFHLKDPNSYAVIRLDNTRIDTYTVGKTVAQELGVPLADVTSHIAGTRGFIVEEVSPEQAEKLVRTLGAMGVRAAAVPCRNMLSLPRAITLRGVHVHANGIDARTEWEDFSILWSEMRLIACGKIRSEKKVKESLGSFEEPGSVLMAPMSPTTGLPTSGMPRSRWKTVTVEEIVFDVFHADPKLRFRFWEGRFRLDGLDARSDPAGMAKLAGRFVDKARGVFLSPALTALAQGDDLSGWAFGGRGAFERHIRYLFLLEEHTGDTPKEERGRWLEF